VKKLYKINGNAEEFADLDVFHKLSQQFLPFAQEKMQFDKPVAINLISDPENGKNPLGKTAYYNPGTMEVTVFVDNRHIKDILRSMSHELVHHTQNCRGEFDGEIHTGPGYAQEDEHMRKMEEEAYLKGQMTLRDFEDNLKENKRMSKLNENREGSLKRLIQGAVEDAVKMGKGTNEIGQMVVDIMLKAGVNLDPRRNILDPGKDPDTKEIQKIVNRKEREKMDAAMRAKMPSMLDDDELGQSAEARFEEGKEPVEEEQFPDLTGDGKVTQADILKGRGVELDEEESLEEGDGTICEECGGSGLHETHCGKGGRAHGKKDDKKEKESLEEGWSNKKDQLLFERLVDKWIK
jgi:hypothetical protein